MLSGDSSFFYYYFLKCKKVEFHTFRTLIILLLFVRLRSKDGLVIARVFSKMQKWHIQFRTKSPPPPPPDPSCLQTESPYSFPYRCKKFFLSLSPPHSSPKTHCVYTKWIQSPFWCFCHEQLQKLAAIPHDKSFHTDRATMP